LGVTGVSFDSLDERPSASTCTTAAVAASASNAADTTIQCERNVVIGWVSCDMTDLLGW
jgi:hypothetical protein